MFKYFKYPTDGGGGGVVKYLNQYRNSAPDANVLVKAKSMAKYVASVLFGNLPGTEEIPVVFHPDAGARLRPHFERHFGQRGANLVALLGKGYSKDDLKRFGAQ